MPLKKSQLIEAYRIATSPYRRYRYAKMLKSGQVPTMVLFYHRVADGPMNPWTIGKAAFKEQIQWIQERFDIVSLEENQKRIASGHNTRPTISITFDDGYSENCEFALPFLIEQKLPVTYFVTTMNSIEQKPFQHDVELGRPLPVNTIESLRALASAGVEIGGHTKTHADLGKINCPKQLIDEVISSTLKLEALVEKKIRYFAFPYGKFPNLNRDAFALLRHAGIKGVCSAYGGWNDIGGDPFHLQRLHGDPNMSRIKNWLSFDPRISKTERYDHEGGEVDEVLLNDALESNENKTEEKQPEAQQEEATPQEYDENDIIDYDFTDTISLFDRDPE